MTDSASTSKERDPETTIGNFLGAFIYKAEQLILHQAFEQPLEMIDTLQIWGSPLGHELTSLYISQLGTIFSSGKQLVPKEVVVLVAKEYLELLRSEMSKPIDFDAIFSHKSQERQKYWKEQFRQVQESGLLEPMLEGFSLFLDNIANEAQIATNDTPLSSEESLVISLYLVLGWNLSNMLIIVVSSSDEDRSGLLSYQPLEYKAVLENVMGLYGWGGDRNKAFTMIRNALLPKLNNILRRLRMPGSRYEGPDSWDEPRNEERQLLQIGLLDALELVTRRNLINILPDVRSGELSNAIVKVVRNYSNREIRKARKGLGIGIIPKWRRKSMSKNEIKEYMRVPKEFPDYELRVGEDEGLISIIKIASDKEAFKQHLEDEAEENKKALLKEKINQFKKAAKLTDRMKIMARYFNEDDTTIATILEKAFGKPVRTGTVRSLRVRLLERIRDVITKK